MKYSQLSLVQFKYTGLFIRDEQVHIIQDRQEQQTENKY